MCRVQYTLCPDTVDCSEATPVTGNIELSLPGNLTLGVDGAKTNTILLSFTLIIMLLQNIIP